MEVLIKLSDAIKTLKSMAVPLVRKLPSAQPERLTDYSFEESCTECPAYDTENHRCPRFNQVIRTALKDANLEPCENCISRQAAIDAFRKEYGGIKNANMDGDFLADEIEFVLSKLPPAQPERLTDYSFEESCTECPAYDTENHRCPRFNQVIRTALKDANLEPCENCISRQAAIDALGKVAELYPWRVPGDRDSYSQYNEAWQDALNRADSEIEALPSAQPDIIRCGDCKWYGRADKRRFYRGMDCLQKRIDTIVPDRDFCSKAERRTDDSISD